MIYTVVQYGPKDESTIIKERRLHHAQCDGQNKKQNDEGGTKNSEKDIADLVGNHSERVSGKKDDDARSESDIDNRNRTDEDERKKLEIELIKQNEKKRNGSCSL